MLTARSTSRFLASFLIDGFRVWVGGRFFAMRPTMRYPCPVRQRGLGLPYLVARSLIIASALFFPTLAVAVDVFDK
jgi:hypothetical protein